MSERTRQEKAYAAEKGADKLAAQQALAKEFWGCCGEPKDGLHHEGCRLYDPNPPPVIHADQETLL